MIAVDAISVGTRTVVATVAVDERSLRTSTSPEFSNRASTLLPGLVRHRCENGSSHGILAELADTETAHALEHITFELMALSGSPRKLTGSTRWDFAQTGRGVFEVELEYDDDVVALGALKAAVPMTSWLLRPEGSAPDVDAAVARLRELRGLHAAPAVSASE